MNLATTMPFASILNTPLSYRTLLTALLRSVRFDIRANTTCHTNAEDAYRLLQERNRLRAEYVKAKMGAAWCPRVRKLDVPIT